MLRQLKLWKVLRAILNQNQRRMIFLKVAIYNAFMFNYALRIKNPTAYPPLFWQKNE
jgi:hypothetical protein